MKIGTLFIIVVLALLAAIASPMAIPDRVQAAPIDMDTGMQSPSATTSIGNGSFFNASYAYNNDGNLASFGNGCTQVYYNYNLSIPSRAVIKGVEVKPYALLDDNPRCTWGKFLVYISGDGGLNWTDPKDTGPLESLEKMYILGGPTDGWGETWNTTELSNANFRVKIVSQTDWYCSLDWLPVIVHYEYEKQPDITVNPVSISFGSISEGESSPAKTITVINNGDADLVIGDISIEQTEGTDWELFSIIEDNCSNETLGEGDSAELKVIFSPDSSGAKSATLKIPSNDPDESEVYVTLNGNGNTLPTADFSATPRSGNEPLTVKFTNLSVVYDVPATWAWDFDNNKTIDSTEKNPTWIYSYEGEYTVSLTVTEADGGSDNETKLNYISVSDTGPVAGFSATPISGKEPLTVSFKDTSISYDSLSSWVWDFGDGQTSSNQNTTHKYAQDGTYTVSLTVIDSDGDSDTKTSSIIVSDTGPIANFSATTPSGDEPLTVNFTDKSTSYDGISSWLWDFGDDQTSDTQNPTHIYTQDGTYTVSLTVTDNDGTSDTKIRTDYILVKRILAHQTISPSVPATVKSEDDQIIIEFPEGSVVEDTTVTIREKSQGSIPACPSGFKAGNTCFSVDMTSDLVADTELTITVKYSDADLEACGGDPKKLTLSRYDENTGKWVILPTTVDTEAKTLTASTSQLSAWLVMVDENPNESGGTSFWIWFAAVGGGLIILLGGSSTLIMVRARAGEGNRGSSGRGKWWPTGMSKDDWV